MGGGGGDNPSVGLTLFPQTNFQEPMTCLGCHKMLTLPVLASWLKMFQGYNTLVTSADNGFRFPMCLVRAHVPNFICT